MFDKNGNLVKINNFTDPASLVSVINFSENNKYIPKRYTNYSSIVSIISKLYNCESTTSGDSLSSIINFRVGFISGGGAVITSPGRKEKKFIDSFIKYNDLNSLLLKDAVLTGEMEGKALLQLQPENGNIRVKIKNWLVNKYKILTDPYDYTEIVGAQFKFKDKEIILEPEEFVYVKLSGSPDKINDTPPVVSNALWSCQVVDLCLRDLRLINAKTGFATLHFETQNSNDAEEIIKTVRATDWQPGATMASPSKPELITPGVESAEIFEKEIELNAQLISGRTGVPLHFMGLIGIFSNRATAQELSSMASNAMAREKAIWTIKLKELVKKAMLMSNELYGTAYKVDEITVEIPSLQIDEIKNITEVYMPLWDKGLVSGKYVVDKLPDSDYEIEQSRIKEEQESITEEQPIVSGEINVNN